MVSNKKSYAMKMLQLALALSLLHIDPQQRLRDWDSQLELRDGDGWELEMLRAVPMVEYPYANRKTMMPLIEDLILFDRQNDHHENQYNVTAYLLNVSNESSNQTAALQEMQALPTSPTNNAPSAGTPATATSTSSLDSSSATISSVVSAPAAVNSSFFGSLPSSEIELFLNSENVQDQRTIWEQNLADLNDFNDLPIMNSHYGNLPLKDGLQDNNLFDVQLDAFLPSIGSSASTPEVEGAVALNDTFPNPDEGAGIKLEQLDDDDKALLIGVLDTRAVTAPSTDEITLTANSIKKEEPEEFTGESSGGSGINDISVDLSPFISSAELTKEESEIVEVLWKQDVDLGYSLTSEQLSDAGTSAKALQYSAANDDDIEKLKALEALKLDNSKYDPKDIDDGSTNDNLDDEWAGIPFTIDNETGEYIRLPLDEILNDVIHFAELAGEEEEQNTGASTSKAAAENNKQPKSVKEEINEHQKPNSATNSSETNKIETDLDQKYESDLKDDLDSDNNNKNLKKQNDNNNSVGIVSRDKDEVGDEDTENDLPQSEIEVSSLPSPLFDLDDEAKEELDDLSMMLHSSAPFAPHHHHPSHPHAHHTRAGSASGGVAGVQNYGGVNSAFHRQPSTGGFHHGHHQGRMPSLSRAVSMEHRFQDIAASLFNPMSVVGGVSEMSPYSHYPTHPYSYQNGPQHGQYPPPPPPPHPHHHHHHHAAAAAMLHQNASLGDLCSAQPHYGHNLGSAVTSSMHLTNSSHDSDVSAPNIGAYKMEHDMMYYSNASTDMNHTTDGFINSILNDEDLHLMDMNVNDSFCRMVDVNNSTSNNSSVLGISSGHANSASGPASGSSSGISMSASNVATAGGAAGMTSELMNTAGTQSGTDRLDASSDSAVSSMGSERVPSLSDGEWGEGSDSAQDYHQGKYGGPYDYSYNNTANSNRLNDGTRQPPVAQKKHHMFGKRYPNEQPGINSANSGNPTNTVNGVLGGPAHSIKYEYEPYPPVAGLHESMGNILEGGAMGGPTLSKEHLAYGGAYSLDFSVRTPRTAHEIVQHNHTYTLPQGTGSLPRPQQRDKKMSTSSSSTKSSKSAHNSGSGGEEDNYMTRDEKRARAMNIPIPVTDIINLPMDEFNERLSKYDLSENQLSLIRDIRRRGKNKVAAQNCRKRKLDQILSLEDEVKQVRRRKEDLQAQHERLFNERKRVSNKFGALHRHIFQYLRDPEGNPCSPSEYSLQQAADGSIYLLPRDAANKNDTASGVLQHSSTANGSSQSAHHQQMPQSHTTTHMGVHNHQHLQHQATATATLAGGTLSHHHPQQSHQQHLHQSGQPSHPHHTQAQHGGGSVHQQKD